jgi:hypothetical protein
MLVDSYAARFDTALARTSQLQTISFVDKQRVDGIKEKITESEKNYNSMMDKANLFAHGAYFYEPCPAFGDASLSDYVGVVSGLARVAPLSPEVMDLVFHIALLSSTYEDLQVLGDKMLATKGSIRIPFEDIQHHSFDVVIDAKLKTLSTQIPVSRRSEVLCPARLQRVNTDKWPKLVPFNLTFDQIRGISQNGKPLKGTNYLDPRTYYALSFDPEGVAPWPALHSLLETAAGPEALLQATRNLGLYIIHVIGNPNIKAELADPEKAKQTSHGFGFGDALMALYGATNGRTPLGAAAVQMMADDKARSEMVTQEQQAMAQKQQATWQAMVARDYSDLLNGSVFDSLDKLIAVTQ